MALVNSSFQLQFAQSVTKGPEVTAELNGSNLVHPVSGSQTPSP